MRLSRVCAPKMIASAEPRLHTALSGTAGPRVVILPGVGATTRYWESRIEPLATSARITLVDPLGFGQSPKPWTRYSVDRHVAALHRSLDGDERFTLVGHSFGANLAVAYAARHAERVNGLILISLPFFGSVARARQYFRRGGSPIGWVMTNLLIASIACVVTRRLMRRALPRLLPDMPREVVEDSVQHTWRSSTSTIWEVVYRYDVGADLQRAPAGMPVLLLHGDQDATAPIEGARRLLLIRPGATLEVLPGGDHHLLLRDPAWVLSALRTFLANSTMRLGARG